MFPNRPDTVVAQSGGKPWIDFKAQKLDSSPSGPSNKLHIQHIRNDMSRLFPENQLFRLLLLPNSANGMLILPVS